MNREHVPLLVVNNTLALYARFAALQERSFMMKQFRTPLGIPLLALVLAGCGANTDTAAPSQVAARVGSYEITVHQVNAELARLGGVAGAQVKQAGSAILERLIDQELLVAHAEEQKIDRDPAVMAALDAARREVVARAYVERITAQVADPQTSEVEAFYRDNPELFSKRRIYALRELRVSVPAGRETDLRAVADKATSLDEIIAWLRREDLTFKADSALKPAEELPLDLVKQLARMKDGEIGVLALPGVVTVVQIAATREQPIDAVGAAPFIERYLTNLRKQMLAREALGRLRGRANIQYVGDFAPASADGATAVTAPGSAPAAALSQAALDKGAGGLK